MAVIVGIKAMFMIKWVAFDTIGIRDDVKENTSDTIGIKAVVNVTR